MQPIQRAATGAEVVGQRHLLHLEASPELVEQELRVVAAPLVHDVDLRRLCSEAVYRALERGQQLHEHAHVGGEDHVRRIVRHDRIALPVESPHVHGRTATVRRREPLCVAARHWQHLREVGQRDVHRSERGGHEPGDPGAATQLEHAPAAHTEWRARMVHGACQELAARPAGDLVEGVDAAAAVTLLQLKRVVAEGQLGRLEEADAVRRSLAPCRIGRQGAS